MASDESYTDPISKPPDLELGLADVRADFIAFYDEEYRPVLAFLMRNGATVADACDAGQDAFLVAWKRMHSGPPIVNRRAWIRKVALNSYRHPPCVKRNQPAIAPGAAIPEQPQPGPCHAELTAQTLHVIDMLCSLDEQDRALVAFHMDGFSAVEAAEYLGLGLTPQQARDALKTARRRLRREHARHQEGGTR